MTLDRDAHLAALERDGQAIAGLCERAGLAAAVPACPGWTLADLLAHLIGVYRMFTKSVAEGRASIDPTDRGERPADAELLDAFRSAHGALLDALRAAADGSPAWSWTDDHTVAFVRRRVAHETAIHRWDAEVAADVTPVLDPALASDGIDEFLTAYLVRVRPDAVPVGGSVHIHCGDVPGEWTIREAADGGFDIAREHAKGDCALRGPAGDLLLALWRRIPLDAIDVVGDAGVAARFVARQRL